MRVEAVEADAAGAVVYDFQMIGCDARREQLAYVGVGDIEVKMRFAIVARVEHGTLFDDNGVSGDGGGVGEPGAYFIGDLIAACADCWANANKRLLHARAKAVAHGLERAWANRASRATPAAVRERHYLMARIIEEQWRAVAKRPEETQAALGGDHGVYDGGAQACA